MYKAITIELTPDNKIHNTPLNVKRNTYPKKSKENRPYNDVNTYSIYFYLYTHKMNRRRSIISLQNISDVLINLAGFIIGFLIMKDTVVKIIKGVSK